MVLPIDSKCADAIKKRTDSMIDGGIGSSRTQVIKRAVLYYAYAKHPDLYQAHKDGDFSKVENPTKDLEDLE